MESDKVSIIILVYKNTEFLKESIESALTQTYPNIEIIAVTEEGTDSLAIKILENYADRIKIIRKEHGNQPSAWNAGIMAMTGEWFKWLSDDDVLYPNCVEELIKEAKKIKEKKRWIFVSNWDQIDSGGKIIKQIIEPNYNELNKFDFNIRLLDRFKGNATSCLIHKTAFDEFGLFNENFQAAPDYELWLRFCLLNGVRMRFVPKTLIKYRIHNNMVTQRTSEEKWRQVNEEVKMHVLNQLDPIERQKYEITLKQFRKKPIIQMTKVVVNNIILKVLPSSSAKKVSKVYRKIAKKSVFS